ncbi:MAG: hypothetical protein H7Y42_10020 [Chitinophagaceae bacterium]|nr:hypothetical protein [Chitinophagaceae bacterium]
MKKILFILSSFIALTAGAQTAEEIIQKYSANIGGLEGYTKAKTAKLSGTISVQGNELPITVQIVNGKSVRSDIDAMGTMIISVYNNGKGWKQNPFAGATTPTDVTGGELNELKSQSFLAPSLMDYKGRGHQVELLGQEDVEGTKAFKLKLTNKDDTKVTTYYIRTSDYLVIKSETERDMGGQSMVVETWYSDLKEVEGLKFFTTRTMKAGGQEFQAIKFDSIVLNGSVDEKIFDMPR